MIVASVKYYYGEEYLGGCSFERVRDLLEDVSTSFTDGCDSGAPAFEKDSYVTRMEITLTEMTRKKFDALPEFCGL